MRAVLYYPESENYYVEEVSLPIPKRGEVRIQVDACSISRFDVYPELWRDKNASLLNKTYTPGVEISGRIETIGDEVKGWKEGDKVICLGDINKIHGGMAEYTIQHESVLVPHPNFSPENTVTCLNSGANAWHLLFNKLRIQNDESVFIAGGDTDIGGYVLQMLGKLEIGTVIASAPNQFTIDFLLDSGVKHIKVFEPSEEYTYTDKILELSKGNGVDNFMCFSDEMTPKDIEKCMSFNGSFVYYSGNISLSSLYKSKKNLSIHHSNLNTAYTCGTQAISKMKECVTNLSDWMNKEMIRPQLRKIISMEEVPDTILALRKAEETGDEVSELRKGIGEIVMNPNERMSDDDMYNGWT